eukprot:TRINITY_DN8131_c0_g1_i1.p1 TRINITY_DN8131_c0_g1~~TRINITY_DN8131_c0_g1_i1.p1  ORF type:complete len:278 (+),score=41.52 TRINITY_DN8131_c0_g1_i1:47-880(+)
MLDTHIRNNDHEISDLIYGLTKAYTRPRSLFELAKKREFIDNLGPLLWFSCGSMAALLQEVMAVYAYLIPPRLTIEQSEIVCNALSLLQCVAGHRETRPMFLSAHIPLYIYPLLSTDGTSKQYEYLRLASLRVIGSLIQYDEDDAISFLISTEFAPPCLRIMESGSEICRTVAIYIVQKVLLDDVGLSYFCHTAKRILAILSVLSNMIKQMENQPSSNLIKHIIRCYLRLTENSNGENILKKKFPEELKSEIFVSGLKDPKTIEWHGKLLQIISKPS